MTVRAPQIEHWFAQLPPQRHDEAQALADQIRASHDSLDEAIKWSRLTFTVDGNWHHWLCAVAVTPRAVNLMFHKGALLDDPAGLLGGNGQYLRSMPFDRARAERDAVETLVGQAVARQTNMLGDAG